MHVSGFRVTTTHTVQYTRCFTRMEWAKTLGARYSFLTYCLCNAPLARSLPGRCSGSTFGMQIPLSQTAAVSKLVVVVVVKLLCSRGATISWHTLSRTAVCLAGFDGRGFFPAISKVWTDVQVLHRVFLPPDVIFLTRVHQHVLCIQVMV